MNNLKTTRLESLDILRGFDLFLLVCFQPLFMRFAQGMGKESFVHTIQQTLFTHVAWEGFHLWDQVMPLFLFMSGVSIPFAYSAYKKGNVSTTKMLRRIVKRVLLLWIFGAIVQGNLLDLRIESLYLYTDTLQAIAMGYLFASLGYMFFSIRIQLVLFFMLPLIYTLGMVLTEGYEPGVNLAEVIDKLILGKYLYGATYGEGGEVIFASWYHISWIYSTLNFTATVVSGVLAGYCLKTTQASSTKLRILLAAAGLCFILSATLAFTIEPIIKRLWTSSMLFLTSGISLGLMALFFYVIDIKQIRTPFLWLKIYGMNSILAYMLYNTVDMRSFLSYYLHGVEPFVGTFYPFVLEIAKVSLFFLLLRWCYKHKIYLKV